MSQTSKLGTIRAIIEIIGIIAVVISLILVWKETQQNRIIAEANFDLMIAQNSLMANQTITEFPDIWRRGCAKDSLSTEERTIFEAMIQNANDLAIFQVSKSWRLKDYKAVQTDWADFVGFLHDNPGARAVWSQREETLKSYREELDINDTSTWYANIIEALESLDKEQNE